MQLDPVPTQGVLKPAEQAFAEKVGAAYRRALANAEFFPEARRNEIVAKLDREYQRFCTVTEHRRSGVTRDELLRAGIGGVLCFFKRHIPAHIRIHSHCSIPDDVLAARKLPSDRARIKLQRKLKEALATVGDLAEYHNKDMASIRQNLTAECERHVRAIDLYARGFPADHIYEICRVTVDCDRIAKLMPDILAEYGGVDLSKKEKAERAAKADEILTRVRDVHTRALAAAAGRSEKYRERVLPVWKRELCSVEIFARLFSRGLLVPWIERLVGCAVARWLKGGVPQMLSGGIMDPRRRDHVKPRRLTTELARVCGGFVANSWAFNPESGVLFSSRQRERIERMKARIVSIFHTEVPEPFDRKGNCLLLLQRVELVKDFYALFGLKSGQIKIPYEILKYQQSCHAFLEEYLAFAGKSVAAHRMRVDITRNTPDSIAVLRCVAVAMYLEGMSPRLETANGFLRVVIENHDDLRRLFTNFGSAFSPEERNGFLTGLSPEDKGGINGLAAYRAIVAVPEEQCLRGKQFDFTLLFKQAGINSGENGITRTMKEKAARWRAGLKPGVALRADKLEMLMRQVYPEA